MALDSVKLSLQNNGLLKKSLEHWVYDAEQGFRLVD
jgi:hypothetical protein